jgi:hypothetical protein
MPMSVRQDVRVSELTVAAAGDVRSWLDRNQFERISTVGGGAAGFGDRQEVWERDGTLFRLPRDRGQWWYDLSRSGSRMWFDVDDAAAALGSKSTDPVERVADLRQSTIGCLGR